MNVYKIELMVLDHDNIGPDAVADELHNGRYGNDCISPTVMSCESRDIGEWDDSNPLNFSNTQADEFARLFPSGAKPAIQGEDAETVLTEVYAAFQIGVKARSTSTLMTNISNALRRSKCLWAIERAFFMVPTEPDEEDDGVPGEECLLRWGQDPEEYVETFREALKIIAASPQASLDGGAEAQQAAPQAEVGEPMDICTDSDNCNRCKRHPDYRNGLAHAGIPLGVPSPQRMAEDMAAVSRGSMCPLCGLDKPHEHSSLEIIIYRNGVKWGRNNGNEPWTGASREGPAQAERPDPSSIGVAVWTGEDQHLQYRAGESDSDRAHDQCHSAGDGLSRQSEVREAVAAPHIDLTTTPVYAPAQQQPVSAEAEEKAYGRWFNGEQGKAYGGMWAFARAAWMYRAALPPQQPVSADTAEVLREVEAYLMKEPAVWKVIVLLDKVRAAMSPQQDEPGKGEA